jgi:hypothetical protein
MQFANSMEKIVSSQGIFGLIQHQAKAKLDFRLFYSVELLRTRRMGWPSRRVFAQVTCSAIINSSADELYAG